MASAELKAIDLLEQANKMATSRTFWGKNRFEEAAELFVKAANQFKNLQMFKEAGDAFAGAADMYTRLKEDGDAGRQYIAAANCYKKTHPNEAIKCFQSGINVYAESGSFNMAAKYMETVAQIYENDLLDLNAAMQSYQQAADWYLGEDASASARPCLLKIATFAAKLENYKLAIEKFEQIADAALQNNLTKYSVKDYFLQAGLCYLAAKDTVGAQRAVQTYKEKDLSFSNTRECAFLENINAAVEEGNVTKFTDLLVDWDRLTRLDEWKTTLLLRIKKSIGESDLL